jgi:hypothetical protein
MIEEPSLFFISEKDPEFKSTNQEESFKLENDFMVGKTHVISYEFPDDYSIKYFKHEQ